MMNSFLRLLSFCAAFWVGLSLSATTADVASGNHHSYVLTTEGVVLSMGEDFYGFERGTGRVVTAKLGRAYDGLAAPGRSPVVPANAARYNPVPGRVQGLQGLEVVRVFSGHNDGAALTADGQLYMWGPNSHGQLGTGDLLERKVATRVEFPEPVKIVDVDMGGGHILAVTSEGDVYAWGFSRNGILGLGEAARSAPVLRPTQIEALADVRIVRVAAAHNTHSLFLAGDGTLYVAGVNRNGQLGIGEDPADLVATAQRIETDARFVEIGVGIHTSFAIDQQGQLWGWGSGSKAHFARQLSDGTPDLSDVAVPTQIKAAPPNLVEVVGGSRHVMVRDQEGRIYTWGIHTNHSGQLGIGRPEVYWEGDILRSPIYTTPQLVDLPGDAPAVRIESLANNNFVVTADGKIYGWGQTTHGRLGYGHKSIHRTIRSNGGYLYQAYAPVEIPQTADLDVVVIDPVADELDPQLPSRPTVDS